MLTINLHPFPVISTERLLLRKIKQSDKNEIFSLRSNETLMKFIDRPIARSVADAIALIKKINESLKNNDGITWGISRKSNPALIGTIGFWRIDKAHHRAEIGYLLQEEYQGKGIMYEAISAALEYAFTVLHLHSVEANVNPANTASIKLLEKLKFLREAYFKENYFYNGIFLDSMIFSILNSTSQETHSSAL